mgnify:CR=1 FL=1
MYRFYSNPYRALLRDIQEVLKKEKISSQDAVSRIKNLLKNRKRLVAVSVVGQLKDGQLSVATARCSKKDPFSRKRGRTIAEGRLNAGILYDVYDCPSGLKAEEFINLASNIVEVVQKSPKLK